MNRSTIKRLFSYLKHEIEIEDCDLPSLIQYGYPNSMSKE